MAPDAGASEGPTPHAGGARERELQRRRRAAELLGDLLPQTSADERGDAWGESDDGARDAQLRRDLPPHHGG